MRYMKTRGCRYLALCGTVAAATLFSAAAFSQGVAPGEMTSAPQSWPPAPAPASMQDPGPGWPPREVNVTRPLPGRPFKEGFADVDGYHVRYVDGGKGPITIVDIPGSGGLELSTAKDQLTKDYRVIELNPPGFGPDDAIVGPRQDNQGIATTFLHTLDKLGITQFHLIATSAGCNIGMMMAQQAPGRVLSITFEGGECFTRDVDRRGQTPRAVAAQRASNMGSGVFDNDYSIWQAWPAYQWSENKWWQTPAFQNRLMRRRYTKVYPTNLHRDEMVAAAKDMKMPVVDLVGDRDEIMKISVAQAWKLNMPQAKFVVVAGGTHDIQNSQPEQFVEIMKACSLDTSPSKLMCPGD
jgi:pimeloyl-ACP methyl ester carboxylesterase